MKPKKEYYRGKLPHFQQPGQWYSVTCTLHGAMPKGAMQKYSLALEAAKNRVKELLTGVGVSGVGVSGVGVSNSNKTLGVGNSQSLALEKAKKDYRIAQRKYRLAYDKFLHKSNSPNISLLTKNNLTTITEALNFWEGKRLHTHAWCIMSNHLHWVVSVFKNDENANPCYLQDILHSIKRHTANQINKHENRSGQLWEHESFDTTIRNERHFYNVVKYTLLNPVSAGLVNNWQEWEASYLEPELLEEWGFGS